MLIFFFLVTAYCSANLYLFFKVSSIMDAGVSLHVVLAIVILFLTLSPVLIPVYSARGSERAVRIFSHVGYLWLAFLVLFFPIGVILDIYNFVIRFSAPLFNGNVTSLLLPIKSTFLIPLVMSLLINIYGYYEASTLRTEHFKISTPKLSTSMGSVRILQISDLHLGALVGERRLKCLVDKIERVRPDIIVSTGDLVDGMVTHISHLSDRLRNLQPTHGKFAVMGNHEIYGGLKHTGQFIRDAGFTVLRDEAVTIDNVMHIVGMDFRGSEARSYEGKESTIQEPEILTGLSPNLFTLLLKHRSDVMEESLGHFDLQLSGHTHKGQIFPMSLATMFLFQYHTGFTSLPKGSAIYVSRGTGTAGPPVRFLSAPEITVIDIVAQ